MNVEENEPLEIFSIAFKVLSKNIENMRKFPLNFKVGIDCRMIAHSGIGVRLYHILKEFTKIKDIPKIYLFGDPQLISKYSELQIFPVIPYYANVYSFQEMWGIKEMNEMDILDIPHFNFPIRYINKTLITIHDLTPYVMKEFFPSILKRLYLKIIINLVKFSKKVISVSDFTKNDLIHYFNFDASKISVVHNAVDHGIFYPPKKSEIKQFKEKYLLPEDYYLSVGIGKGHKNFRFLIDCLVPRYRNKEISIPLVIAGTGGTLPPELEVLVRDMKDYIICAPFLDYNELPFLYAGAKCLLYPSLYEGFGLPLLEAQASGCPVLSSKTSVMPEVLQDSAIYFDPRNPLDFYNALQKFKIYEDLFRDKGLSNVKKYQWNESAEKIINIYYDLSLK